MKYIKSITESVQKYFPDDYVLYDGRTLQSKEDQFIKILRILSWGDYIFMFDDGSVNATDDNHIKRKLTSEEIEEFEIKLKSNKYNL